MEVKCERCGQAMDVSMENVPMCGLVCNQCEAREEESKNQDAPQPHRSGVILA